MVLLAYLIHRTLNRRDTHPAERSRLEAPPFSIRSKARAIRYAETDKDLFKIQQEKEKEVFKIQQESQELFKIQQEREKELFKIQQERDCLEKEE